MGGEQDLKKRRGQFTRIPQTRLSGRHRDEEFIVGLTEACARTSHRVGIRQRYSDEVLVQSSVHHLVVEAGFDESRGPVGTGGGITQRLLQGQIGLTRGEVCADLVVLMDSIPRHRLSSNLAAGHAVN